MVSDRDRWELPELAIELEDLVDRGSDAIAWALGRLEAGRTTGELVEAAAWVALRRTPVEGRSILGLVPHGVLAAPAVDRLGQRVDPLTARMAAVGHVAYVADVASPGSLRHGPMCLRWYEPGVEGDQKPRQAFLAAASSGDTEVADHAWLALAEQEPGRAEEALVEAAAAGAHLQPHKLIYPAELRTWFGDRPLDPRLWRAAVRYVANYLQDPATAEQRRERAAAAEGPTAPTGDVEAIDRMASAFSEQRSVSVALLDEHLQVGCAHQDVAEALALASAARYARTELEHGFAAIGPLHATTGAAAVCSLVDRWPEPGLRLQLLDALREHPVLLSLETCRMQPPELDDDAVPQLRRDLATGDSGGAARWAMAVSPDDAEDAWTLVHAAVAEDRWLVQHGPKQSVALHDRFLGSPSGLRNAYLAAAARTAGLIRALDQPRSARMRQLAAG